MKSDSSLTQMDDSVILLAGAGSSCHLGLPTLDDLLEQVAFGEDEVADRIRRTRDSVRGGFRTAAVFEDLIARIKLYLETLSLLRTPGPLRDGIGPLPYDVDNGNLERRWKQALARCYRILLKEYGPGKIDAASKEFTATTDVLKAFARINGGSLHVFTTNYDCSFQVLAANCTDLAFFTHIDNTNGRFSDGWHLGNPLAGPKHGRIFVHRLHGCVGWFNISSEDHSGLGSFIKEVYGVGSLLEYKDDDSLDQMCIKLTATQLIGTNPAFASAFDEFSGRLRSAGLLFVWGYSFRDIEVVRAINHAFAERTSPLPVLYLDPFLPETTARDVIERTLVRAPVQPAVDLKPRRVPWTPHERIGGLVPAIETAVGETMKRRGKHGVC